MKLKLRPRGQCAVNREFMHYVICSDQQRQQPGAWEAEQTTKTNKQANKQTDGFFLYVSWENPRGFSRIKAEALHEWLVGILT